MRAKGIAPRYAAGAPAPRRDRAAGIKRSAEVEGGRSAQELPGEEARQGRRWRQKQWNPERRERMYSHDSPVCGSTRPQAQPRASGLVVRCAAVSLSSRWKEAGVRRGPW
jgi:hypothetical protein